MRKSLLLLFLASTLYPLPSTQSLYAASWKSITREGVSQYKKGNYVEALKDFDQASQTKSKNPTIEFNRGCASYKLKDHASAARSFEQAKTQDAKPKDKAQSLYNLGNSLLENNKLDNAIQAYKGALLLNPKDADIKHNLALALKRKQKPPEPQKDKNKSQSQDQDQDKNKDQKKQPQPQEQMSQQQLEALLQAFEQEEMEQAKKMQKRRQQQEPNVDKDW